MMKGILALWTLEKEHIDKAAKAVGINPKRITEEDYEDIFKNFIRELRRERGRWRTLLEDVIQIIMR